MTERDRHLETSLRESEVEKVPESTSSSVIRQSSVTTETPGRGIDARSGSESSEGAKHLRRGCSEPGCEVPPSIAVYRHSNGGPACISHAVDQGPKHQATRNGGDGARRRRIRYMPADTPTPDLSTPKAVRAYIEDRLGRIERGELDKRAIDTNLVGIARQTHTDEALEKLAELEEIIKGEAAKRGRDDA